MANTKTCEACGITMTRRKPNGKRMGSTKWLTKRWCGWACRYQGQELTPRTLKPCPTCGKATKNPKYCSKTCMGQAWLKRDGSPELLDHRARNRARARYDMTECAQCHATTDLQRHHIDLNPRHNEPENITILCRRCHSALHVRIRQGTQTPSFLKSTHDQ